MTRRGKGAIAAGFVLVMVFSATLVLWNLDPARHFAGPVVSGSSEDLGHGGFNLLFLGIDARDHEPSRTDAIMVARVQPKTGRIVLISVPRDTRVELSETGFTKINHAHWLGETEGGNHGGTMASVDAVSSLLGCEIKYYVKVDFEGVRGFITAVGGLDIELPCPVTLTFLKKTLPAGRHSLDGDTVLALVRERFSLADGDFGRQRLQYQVIEALGQKLLNPESLPKLAFLAVQAKDYILDTNLQADDFLSLALMVRELPGSGIEYVQIPGHGEYRCDPLVGSELYYWIPDEEGLQEISQLLSGSGGPSGAASAGP